MAVARLFLRTWPFIRPLVLHVALWLGAHVLSGALTAFASLSIMDVVNNRIFVGEPLQAPQASLLLLDAGYVETAALTADQRAEVRDRLVIVLLFGSLLLFVSGGALGYYETWITQQVNQNLRTRMIESAENLSLRHHSHVRAGDAIFRVYQDSVQVSSVVDTVLLDPINLGSRCLIALFVVALFSPWLALLCVLAAVPVGALVLGWTPRIQQLSLAARTAGSNLTSRVQEIFAAIRIIKANQGEARVFADFDRDSTQALDAAFHLRVQFILVMLWIALIIGVAIIVGDYVMAGWTLATASTWLGGAVALAGFAIWNLGAYQAAGGRVDEFFGMGNAVIAKWMIMQDMAVALERAFFLLDQKPGVVDREGAGALPLPVRSVEYLGARFGYDAAGVVLEDVNLTAQAGTVTAIVGATGSGKSTLLSLLLRLYEPQAGVIRINGVDVRDVRSADLRAHVAIALQQNLLFAASVADNIAYALPASTREAVRAAARIACADEFIEALPRGYDTELGERGGRLSSGQRQRLTLARALLRNTPILLLDEPTASLDAETELRVLDNIAAWGRGRIVFIVTHRLSTIRRADQIAFLDGGRIVECGTHAYLMQITGGRYRAFVDAESRGGEVAT